MEVKATIQLDDMELEVIYQALTLASDEQKFQGNQFRAKVNEMVARKIFSEKIRFQDRQSATLEQMYGKVEKASSRKADSSVKLIKL